MVVVIDPSGDLTISVTEYDDSIKVAQGQEKVVLQVVDFLVKRSVIVSNSEPLGALIALDLQYNAKPAAFQMKDLSTTSMEIWFRAFHDAMTPSSHIVKIDEMWKLAVHIILTSVDSISLLTAPQVAGNMYNFDTKLLYPWFEQWYAYHSTRPILGNLRWLLYPCWQYNHAAGFMLATKEAVYHKQLNAAKGRLRTKLHTLTFKPTEALLSATCNCKEKTAFQYIKALHDTGMWPLDREWTRLETHEILDRLGSFKYTPPRNACLRYCQKDYEATIQGTISLVRRYFDGLCLDCMDKSKSKTGDSDSDYWYHNELEENEWDHSCRESHGQPTWYFSFMGRKEDQKTYFKGKWVPVRAP
ncbi:MAG: hypothetical protein Q9191_002421 [Dirinaria sp. TL-2023a]